MGKNEKYRPAADLASAALDLAIADRLEESEAAYRQAVNAARLVEHYALSDYETQLASVLARRGLDAEAETFFRQAVADARQAHDESAPSVGIARYFLSEFLTSRGRAREAIQTLTPALENAQTLEGILRIAEAEALWNLGRTEEARAAASRGLALATGDGQRERMLERLSSLAGW